MPALSYEGGRIRGLPELIRKLDNPTWVHQPARRFLSRWALFVEGQAKRNIKSGIGGWLDTGTTRRSLTHEIDSAAFPKYARAGSNLDAARWGEYGTGLLSEDPESSHKRHWPPASALEPWAAKHGLNAYLVARAIGLRGGLSPRRFLRDAYEESEQHIEGWLGVFAREIEAAASAS